MSNPEKPKPGQESVWNYPRPAEAHPAHGRRVRVIFGGETIAESDRPYRVLETSHPPVYYIPREDVRMEFLRPASGHFTHCEWKGTASYFDIVAGGKESARAAWTYDDPTPSFQPIKGYIAFYPGRLDACYVDDERVNAQEGDFYGGWITSDIVGPFKGGPGTWGW